MQQQIMKLMTSRAFFLLTILFVLVVGSAVNFALAGRKTAESLQQATPVVAASSFLGQGQEAEDKGRMVDAVLAYEKAIADQPDQVVAYQALGELYFRMRLFTKALETYQVAVDRKLGGPELFFRMGYVAEQQRDLSAALGYYLEAERNLSGNPALTFNIGNVYAQMKDNVKALEYYKKAVAQNSKNLDAFVNLSSVSFYQGAYSDAQFYLEKAMHLGYQPDPQYVAVLQEKMKM